MKLLKQLIISEYTQEVCVRRPVDKIRFMCDPIIRFMLMCEFDVCVYMKIL